MPRLGNVFNDDGSQNNLNELNDKFKEHKYVSDISNYFGQDDFINMLRNKYMCIECKKINIISNEIIKKSKVHQHLFDDSYDVYMSNGNRILIKVYNIYNSELKEDNKLMRIKIKHNAYDYCKKCCPINKYEFS
jgi:hypothetical protein